MPSNNLLVPASTSLPPRRQRQLDIHQPSSQQAVANGGLLKVASILRRSWRRLVLLSLLGLMAGLFTAVLQTPVYQAKATMEVQELNGDFLDMRQVTPISGFLNAQTDIQTQIKAVQSPILLKRAAERLKLKKALIESARAPQPLWRTLARKPARSGTFSDDDIAVLTDRVKARVIPQTRDFEVIVDSGDPQIAAAYANEICNVFIEQNIEARRALSHDTGQWLDGLLREMRVKLQQSEAALQTYAQSAQLVFNSDKENLSDEKLRQLQAELSKAQADRIDKESRYEIAKQSPDESWPDVVNDATLRDYESRLTDLKRQKADLSTTYTADYGKLKRIEAEIATLESAVAARREKMLFRIRNEFDTAARRERALTSVHQAQTRQVSRDSEKAIQYSILRREVEGNQQVYGAMLRRAQEAAMAAGMRASNIRVVDSAAPPSVPYRPQVAINAALGLLSGVLFGSVLLFARDRTDAVIRQPGDISQYLHSAELGVILHNPDAKRQSKFQSLNPLRPMRMGGSAVPGALLCANTPMVADSFRGVLTSMLFVTNHHGGKPIFAVTSPGPGEGKTYTVANLGIALSEVVPRVLLIDGDLRKPTLHTMFGLGNERNFVDLIKSSSDADPEPFLQATQVPGLWVATGRGESAETFRLLHSARLREVLADLKKRFDVILIDTPPA
ncbi:MAG: polysaccharide biosynthesis tyrosine autokinase, partial [Acidobacteriota bacterium]|nr:polysaccharide biosynthesis tyrosine autokinase [Acidobacteriota bacterium]